MPSKSSLVPQRPDGRPRQHTLVQALQLLPCRRVRSVSIQPGSTALTWMLSGAQPTASDLVNCTMPPLLAP